MFRFGEMHDKRPEMAVRPWVGKMTPFRMIGNVYYIGTYQACCYLIDTGEGLIMIDPGYAKTTHLVLDSIYKLGFKPEDIKYIFCTHWHGDHAEATEAFVDLSGAKTLIGKDDEEKAKRYFQPDILISDGDKLTLGNTTITFMHTPGHTAGTTSFFLDVEEDGKVYRAGSFGGAGRNTLVPGKYDFEGAREAYFASLDRLRGEKVEVFIGNHAWNNDTYGKSVRLLAGGKNEFIDESLWGRFLDSCEESLRSIIEKEAVSN